MKIILIRHAESLANQNPKWYLYPDCVNILSTRGVNQAIELNMKMIALTSKSKKIKIISSSLIRAKLTADIAMHNTGLTVHHDARLNECIEDAHGIIIETSQDAKKRMRSLVEENHCDLILFSHCNFMRSILNTTYIKNTEIKIFNRQQFYALFLAP